MSMAEDDLIDDGYEILTDQEEYIKARQRYELLNTAYIINRLIEYGEDANCVTEYFPAYDVALKCRKQNNEATVKQHNAMAHVLAYIDKVWN